MKSGHMGSQHRLQWLLAGMLVMAAFGFADTGHAATPVAKPVAAHTVLVMGDSLSAAHGLAEAQGWVALLAPQLAARKPAWTIVNASISGETSAGGAARAAHELALHPCGVLVVELGANDALRGLPLQQMRANLAKMIDAGHSARAKVLLVGMRIPPNYGPAYTREFEQSYRDLAQQHGATLLPFLLEPIARDRGAFQDDNLHPVASAEPRLRDHVWKALEPLLK